MHEKVEAVLSQIKPALQADGGDVQLVDVDEENGIVKVRLIGSCSHCPMSSLTLKEGIEKVIKSKVKEINEVVAV